MTGKIDGKWDIKNYYKLDTGDEKLFDGFSKIVKSMWTSIKDTGIDNAEKLFKKQLQNLYWDFVEMNLSFRKKKESGGKKSLTALVASEKAIEYINKNGLKKKDGERVIGLAYEHAIPKDLLFNDIIDSIKKGKDFTGKDFEKLFKKYFFTAVITVEEDKIVNDKLRSKMPDGWKAGDSPLARYEKNKIKIVTSPTWVENVKPEKLTKSQQKACAEILEYKKGLNK